MTIQEKTDAMIEWYKDRELPAGPIPYRKGEIIQEPGKFVANQLQALAGRPGTRFFRNAYIRLWELKRYLLEHIVVAN